MIITRENGDSLFMEIPHRTNDENKKKGAGCQYSCSRDPACTAVVRRRYQQRARACGSQMAFRQLNRDTAVTADILLSHVDHVTSIARHANQVTARLASMPCESVLQQMTATGSLTPYIRSTGLVKEDILVCSSVTGARQQSVSAVFGVPVSAPTGTLKITATLRIRRRQPNDCVQHGGHPVLHRSDGFP